VNALLADVDPVRDPDGWLEWRRGGIGASDIAGVMGLSPWSSAWSVWADKVGLAPPQPTSELMEAGRWLELAIAPWAQDRTGMPVTGMQTALEDPDLEWMRCTADGFVGELAAPDALLEIKTTGYGRRWETVPVHYQCQAQWQMAVTALSAVVFAVLHGRRLEIYRLERDPADIEVLIQAADRFWHAHVLERVAPPLDGSAATADALAAIYPLETPGASVALDELEPVLGDWRAARAAESAAKRERREAESLIKAALGDAEEGTISGRRAVTWRSQTRAAYTVAESTYRVLREAKGD
jgi:putative phage-type endonuclease